MLFYFSGCDMRRSSPEIVLESVGGASLMLTYFDYSKKQKPDKRFRNLLQMRRMKKKGPKNANKS